LNTSSNLPPSAGRRRSWRLSDWFIYALIAGLLGMVILRSTHGPKEGTPAQAFSLQLVGDEGKFRLAEQRGKPVLMEVFASWCGACESAAPMLEDVHREAAQKGVVLVGVSIDQDPDAARDVKRSWRIPYPVALDDGSVKRGYGVSLVPTFVLIDRDGIIRRVSSGVPSRRTLSRWLTEL
jgi:thiol-disulfide isomerase/thioredoxin